MHWRKIVFIAACLLSPLYGWAETSSTIPHASSATDSQILEEALYWKEETVSMASRYEQPISQAPSNVYVITDRGYPPVRRTYRFWQQTATAGYRREAEVAGSVFNALNDTHKEHPLGDLIGSRVMGWLTVTL